MPERRCENNLVARLGAVNAMSTFKNPKGWGGLGGGGLGSHEQHTHTQWMERWLRALHPSILSPDRGELEWKLSHLTPVALLSPFSKRALVSLSSDGRLPQHQANRFSSGLQADLDTWVSRTSSSCPPTPSLNNKPFSCPMCECG